MRTETKYWHYYSENGTEAPIRALAGIRKPHMMKKLFVVNEFDGTRWFMPVICQAQPGILQNFKYIGKVKL